MNKSNQIPNHYINSVTLTFMMKVLIRKENRYESIRIRISRHMPNWIRYHRGKVRLVRLYRQMD